VVGLGLAVAVVLTLSRHPGAAPSVTSTRAPSSSDVGADEVALDLTAEAPIDRVSAPGIHGAQVDGAHVRLLVARWGGDLAIDATLEGGLKARVVARSEGPRTLRLLTVPADAAPSDSTAPGGSAAGPALSASARPGHLPVRPTGTRPPAELHSNPYGQ
jgi:hypothetical protein